MDGVVGKVDELRSNGGLGGDEVLRIGDASDGQTDGALGEGDVGWRQTGSLWV